MQSSGQNSINHASRVHSADSAIASLPQRFDHAFEAVLLHELLMRTLYERADPQKVTVRTRGRSRLAGTIRRNSGQSNRQCETSSMCGKFWASSCRCRRSLSYIPLSYLRSEYPLMVPRAGTGITSPLRLRFAYSLFRSAQLMYVRLYLIVSLAHVQIARNIERPLRPLQPK
jgi:hypothetical protein